jgi:mutator protein MutT
MSATPGIHFPGVGTGLVVLKDQKILLCKRLKAPEAQHWSIPGGKVDHGEHSSQAAIRETLEETGLTAQNVTFLCLSEHIFPDDNQHWLSTVYIAEGFSGTLTLMEPDKLEVVDWFSLSELPQPLSRFAKDAIDALLKRQALAIS